MAERDPIELIKEQLGRADDLATLHGDHDLFKDWCGQTKVLLEKIFSSKSVHVQTFVALRFREVTIKAFASPEIDRINAARYKKDLETAKNILHGAVKELAVDRTLFKKIQTTPKTVEVSLQGECYLSAGLSDPVILRAIEQAFENKGLTAVHGTEEGLRSGLLSHRIERIKCARLGIYDVSMPENTEGLLELGIAIGLGREAIVIHRRGSGLPEGIQSLDRIEYGDPAELAEILKKRIRF